MPRKRRKKNPVNLDHYGDLFYDAAEEFNGLVDELITVAFNVDRTSEKITRKMVKAAAMAIVERWHHIMRGKRPMHDTSGVSDLAMRFNEIVMVLMAEVFEGDAIMSDDSPAAHKKRIRSKDLIAGALVKAWHRAYH